MRLRCLLLPLLALALTACPQGVAEQGAPDSGVGAPDGDDPSGLATNEDCTEIPETFEDGTACARCTFDGGEVEICGQRLSARCTELENAFGEACQRCVADGQVLYDDCVIASGGDDENLTCEQVEEAEIPPADRFGEEPGSFVVDDGQSCEVCYDDAGNVVRARCRPDHDECAEVTVGGQDCLECTFDGELAFRECEPRDLDPDVCEAYGDEGGSCLDCYQDDQLISHACTPAAPDGDQALELCTSFETFDGLFCTECTDASGNVTDFFCAEGPQATFCEQLQFDEARQLCLICVDEDGGLASSECYDLDCLADGEDAEGDPEACTATAPCTMLYTPDGQVCRECPVLDEDGQPTGEVETECLAPHDGRLEECYEVVEEVPAPGQSDDPESDPVYVEQVCVECTDADGNVTYRECETDGSPAPPPTCVYEPGPDGEQCLVCYDSETGAVVAEDCEQPAPSTCSFHSALPVTGPEGDPISLTSPSGVTFEPLADCEECDDPNTQPAPDAASCTLRVTCEGEPLDGDGGENEPAPDDGFVAPEPAACVEGVPYYYEIPQCGAPWALDGQQTLANVETSLSVLGWLAGGYDLLPYSAFVFIGGPAEECASCDCASGRVVEVWAGSDDATAGVLLELGFTADPTNTDPGAEEDPDQP